MDEARRDREDPQKKKDAETLAGMLIYHGQFLTNPLVKTRGESWAKKALLMGMRGDEMYEGSIRMGVDPVPHYRGDDPRGQHWYGCRHIQLNGDCGNYENRPSMCRSYPDGRACNFEGCTMTTVDMPAKHKSADDLTEDLKASVQLVEARSLTKKVKEKAAKLDRLPDPKKKYRP